MLKLNSRGYRLYYGTASRQYGTSVDVGNVTTYNASGLGAYYFSVKACGNTGEESAFSNEATTTISGNPDTQPPVINGVTAFTIFGTRNLSVLSAIPPQVIQ